MAAGASSGMFESSHPRRFETAFQCSHPQKKPGKCLAFFFTRNSVANQNGSFIPAGRFMPAVMLPIFAWLLASI